MKLERFYIPSCEADARLEVVVAKPQQPGPYPTIIFNHGSTGRGHNNSFYKRTWCPTVVARYFIERGWMILFPQRRGRGKSSGSYGEGLAPDGSGYSCDIDIALAGFERAVEDIDSVVRHLRERSDVDQSQLIIGGVSRGGILSIAYAGMRPTIFKGAINFSGGWLGRACANYEIVNPLIFERGASAGISTLWLHGSFDQYYRIGHCRGTFEKFLSAGGQGKFIGAAAGHGLLFKPALWKKHLDHYLDDIANGITS
ncbi:MAG: alpha/beta hydrolase [Rhizobiales bacterium]|nr:alpha/beta hydrolase [Hyphomicrobiales bacterium]